MIFLQIKYFIEYFYVTNKFRRQRFKVLTAVSTSMLFFWALTPCGLAGRYQLFGETTVLIVVICLQVNGALQPRRTSTGYRPIVITVIIPQL